MEETMIDRNALAREMLEAWKIDKGLPCEKAADIAIRHIAQARAEGYEAGLKAGFYEGVQAAHENIGLPQDPPA
jgi:flagellar biosynthesis/type III secretory pathway protein FliH